MSKEEDKNMLHGREVVDKEAVFNMMAHNDRQSELHRMAFAKEVAIGFANYINDNWLYKTGVWYKSGDDSFAPLTDEQLFNQYIQSLQSSTQ